MMRYTQTLGLMFGLPLMILTLTAQGQQSSVEIDRETKLIEAAMEIMDNAGVCALITLDEKGLPDARVMDPFPAEADLTVWFGTNPRSRKVAQIEENPNATLYYLAKDASGYVVIHGKASLVNDQTEKDKRWKASWQAFYPNNAGAYLLIKVTPDSMEVVSYPHGITGDPVSWKAPAVVFDAE